MVPLYLGIRAVIVKSFARIHCANLVNAGILPLTFANEADYDRVSQGDRLCLPDVRARLQKGEALTLVNETTGETSELAHALSDRQVQILLCGGLLDYTREQN